MLSRVYISIFIAALILSLSTFAGKATFFEERKISIDYDDFFDPQGNAQDSIELVRRKRRYKITIKNIPADIKFVRFEGKKNKKKVKQNKVTLNFKTGKISRAGFLSLESFKLKNSPAELSFARLNILNKTECPEPAEEVCAFIFFGNESRVEPRLEQRTFANSCLAEKSNASTMYARVCDGESFITDFIKDNPENSAIHLIENDEAKISFNSSRVQPLASAMKTIVAIEYAKQVAENKITANEQISLEALDIFFVEGTDGGAHQAWLDDMEAKGFIIDGKVPLEEVTKGMIAFSSNANTEFLMEKLSLDSINKNLGLLSLDKHDPLWEIVSYLFTVFKKSENISIEEHIANLNQLSREDFATMSNEIHQVLKNDIDGSFKETINRDLIANFDVSKIFSANFTSATAQEYAELMQKINSRSFFDSNVQGNIDAVMEGIFNPNLFQHLGGKGGSTAFVLTNANYVTDIKGNKVEFAVFFQDLELEENIQLQENWTFFFLNLIVNSEFRNTVIESFTNQ